MNDDSPLIRLLCVRCVTSFAAVISQSNNSFDSSFPRSNKISSVSVSSSESHFIATDTFNVAQANPHFEILKQCHSFLSEHVQDPSLVVAVSCFLSLGLLAHIAIAGLSLKTESLFYKLYVSSDESNIVTPSLDVLPNIFKSFSQCLIRGFSDLKQTFVVSALH